MVWGETGHATQQDAFNEFKNHVEALIDAVPVMLEHEQKFITEMSEKIEKFSSRVYFTPKMLFWLRDLHEKYL